MIKAEIKKGLQTYLIDLPMFISLEEAYKYAVILATGQDYHTQNDLILDLGTSQQYDHIKVWYEQPQLPGLPMVEPPQAAGPKEGPIPFTARLTFLEQKIQLEGAQEEYADKTYYLPAFINGVAALDAMNSDSLESLLLHYAASTGVPATNAVVVMPHAALPDLEEAVAYLGDYVDEIRKTAGVPTQKKTARAYTGWNDKG